MIFYAVCMQIMDEWMFQLYKYIRSVNTKYYNCSRLHSNNNLSEYNVEMLVNLNLFTRKQLKRRLY